MECRSQITADEVYGLANILEDEMGHERIVRILDAAYGAAERLGMASENTDEFVYTHLLRTYDSEFKRLPEWRKEEKRRELRESYEG